MSDYMTAHEVFEWLERERANRPWYQKAYWAARRPFAKAKLAVYNFFGNLVNRYQRSKYGIGYRDRWTYPSYIAGLIAHSLEIEAEEGYTYPGEERGFTAQKWKQDMLVMARHLREYQDAYNAVSYPDGWFEDLERKHRRAQKEMHRFANLFEYIGD